MPPLVAGLAMNILNAVGAGASDAAALMGHVDGVRDFGGVCSGVCGVIGDAYGE